MSNHGNRFSSEHQPERRGAGPRVSHPTCPCVAVHRPVPVYLQVHHIVPQSWGGPNTAENKIAICGTTHDATHDLLNKLVRAGQDGYVEMRGYPTLARTLALRAIEAYRGSHQQWPKILTVAHPD